MPIESLAAKIIVALSALASFTEAALVCSTSALSPPAEYPDGDCGMPDWGFPAMGAFAQTGTKYDRHIVTTPDGYELSMVRLTDTASDGDFVAPFADAGSKGPVLL